MTNQEMAADMISLIRRYAIDLTLISYEGRNCRAVDKLKKVHKFCKQELNWIARMEKYLMEESVLNVSVFDEDGRVKKQGFAKINRILTTQEIVSKLWNLCNVLCDDGITYHQYVTELTYILFLKMAKETGAQSQIPENYR